MSPNPFAALAHSRKFWLLILDTVVSLVTLVGGLYLAPERLEIVLGLIATIQPVFVFVINAIASEDNAERSLEESRLYLASRDKSNDQSVG